MTERAWIDIRRMVYSLVLVASITAAASVGLRANATTAGFLYLIGILGIATAWGRAQSVAASITAVLCFNYYFLPPLGRFTIEDPENWVALFAFLVTSLVASHLSDRAKQQALEARQRQRETEQLYALSRAILLSDKSQSIGVQAVQHLAQIFECQAVVLYDARSAEMFRGGPADLVEAEVKLKQAVMQGSSVQEPGPGQVVAAITLGGHPIGGLAMAGCELSDGALQALLNLVAIALERVRTEEAANRAEAARQSEEFKSTLMDAIAHEFKTPLTSIKAAATALQSDYEDAPPAVRELASIIDEETDRLSQLVTEGVRMSEIDAAKVRLQRRPVVLAEIVEAVVGQFATRVEGRDVLVSAEAGLPQVRADAELLSLALRQLIDNGLKYSPPGARMELRAWEEAGRVLLSVRDGGAGIPERDRERVFEKFYRRGSVRGQIPGSGMGLYIAREIVRAHEGELWVAELPGGVKTEFRLALPVDSEGSGE